MPKKPRKLGKHNPAQLDAKREKKRLKTKARNQRGFEVREKKREAKKARKLAAEEVRRAAALEKAKLSQEADTVCQ